MRNCYNNNSEIKKQVKKVKKLNKNFKQYNLNETHLEAIYTSRFLTDNYGKSNYKIQILFMNLFYKNNSYQLLFRYKANWIVSQVQRTLQMRK